MKKNKMPKFLVFCFYLIPIAIICFGIFHYGTDFWKTRTINNFKVVANEYKSGKKIKLSENEISLIMVALAIEFRNGLNQATNLSKSKTNEEVLSKIVNFQMKMRQDLSELLEISRYSLGEDDPETINIKKLLNDLDQALKKQGEISYWGEPYSKNFWSGLFCFLAA